MREHPFHYLVKREEIREKRKGSNPSFVDGLLVILHKIFIQIDTKLLKLP